jgi:hypothetical protein
MLISKTTFLQFQMCPKDTWLKLHKPELVERIKPSQFELHLMEQGSQVEAWARKLFPDGRLITATYDEACLETQRLMTEGTNAIFQATFVANGFIAKCDVLVWGGAAWDIYEIKGTNSKKERKEDSDHISDLAFQAVVLEKAGVTAGRLFIIHLNKEYVRDGDIDVESLFVKYASTEQVDAKRAEIVAQMQAAKEFLGRSGEPGGGCDCHYNGRSRHCRTFAYSHPEIPKYSVHDIVCIGRRLSRERITRTSPITGQPETIPTTVQASNLYAFGAPDPRAHLLPPPAPKTRPFPNRRQLSLLLKLLAKPTESTGKTETRPDL